MIAFLLLQFLRVVCLAAIAIPVVLAICILAAVVAYYEHRAERQSEQRKRAR